MGARLALSASFFVDGAVRSNWRRPDAGRSGEAESDLEWTRYVRPGQPARHRLVPIVWPPAALLATTVVGHFNDPSSGLHFDVAVRPDKNPDSNCFVLLFTRNKKTDAMGQVLVEIIDESFVLRGMRVSESLRGQ